MIAKRREAAFGVPLFLMGALSLPSGAASPGAPTPPGVQMPSQPQIINLSLLDALIAVKAQDLAGVFGFIPETNAPAAFADYLVHNRKALKLFVEKGRGDLGTAGGINEWDKQVFLYLVSLQSSPALAPGDRLPEKLMARVTDLALARSVPLHEIALRRGKR